MSVKPVSAATQGLGVELLKSTGVDILRCYQCGKCTAGCSLAQEMDYSPSYLLRMLQAGGQGNEEKILRSETIWLCLSCEMCYSRCPQSIDIPKAMDYLRQKSFAEGKVSRKSGNIISFHQSFLSSIKRTGRLFELGMTIEYKLRSMKLFQDILLVPAMVSRGKLHLLPKGGVNLAQIKNIFKTTKS